LHRQRCPPGSAISVTLETQPDGTIAACVDRHSLALGQFSARAADRARSAHWSPAALVCVRPPQYRQGDSSLGSAWRLGPAGNRAPQVVIEPQLPDYWPQAPPLGNADVLVLSRFAYIRRRGNEMVLESPRAGAVFKICDPKIAAALAILSTPRQIKELRRQDGFPGRELLALLVDCQILFKINAARDGGLRPAEGDHDLVLWYFHDLLFHARSTEGRHATRWVYPYAGVIPAPPAMRPRWPGKTIDLRKVGSAVAADLAGRNAAAGTRPAALMTGSRSRLSSWRGFSTPPRESNRQLRARSIPATVARWWPTRRGQGTFAQP
jgi:Cyanobactin oxidase ThcOx,